MPTPTEDEQDAADEYAEFIREERELDERQRFWADEAHKLMHELEDENNEGN